MSSKLWLAISMCSWSALMPKAHGKIFEPIAPESGTAFWPSSWP